MVDPSLVLGFGDAPGHLLRRAQQIHTAVWAREVGDIVTGPQYATLVAVAGWPNLDQKRAGELASLDKSTVGGVVKRLESKGWISRATSPVDARRRVLVLTDRAYERLPSVTAAAARVQESLLAPLPVDEAAGFVRLLRAVALADAPAMGQAPRSSPALELSSTPGYLIRRAQQVHFAIWTTVFDGELTSTQYAVLVAAAGSDSVDQSQIGNLASLDSSSVADIVTRLEARGWLTRRKDPDDGRRMIVDMTGPATTAVAHLTRSVQDVQHRLLSPLTVEQARQFMMWMQRLTGTARNDADRVPATA